MNSHEVKQFVARVFIELGSQAVCGVRETLFLDNDKCMAVAYRMGNLSAVWCLNDGIVEFRREGKMLRTVNLLNEVALSSAVAE